MKLILFFLLSIPASAAPWELCLDKADFSLNADTFIKASKVTKAGCKIRFFTLGAKGEKFEIDLCDTDIHINSFPNPNSELITRVSAGSSNCPLPLFGSDFDSGPEDPSKFVDLKSKVFAIYKEILHVYAEHQEKFDPVTITEKNINNSEVQVMCTKTLIEDYLNRCIPFEQKKVVAPEKATKEIKKVL